MEKRYLNTKEVKERFGIQSSNTLHQWRRNKGFPEPRFSGRLYLLTDILEWEEKSPVTDERTTDAPEK